MVAKVFVSRNLLAPEELHPGISESSRVTLVLLDRGLDIGGGEGGVQCRLVGVVYCSEV